jgi:hypothetical protein
MLLHAINNYLGVNFPRREGTPKTTARQHFLKMPHRACRMPAEKGMKAEEV